MNPNLNLNPNGKEKRNVKGWVSGEYNTMQDKTRQIEQDNVRSHIFVMMRKGSLANEKCGGGRQAVGRPANVNGIASREKSKKGKEKK